MLLYMLLQLYFAIKKWSLSSYEKFSSNILALKVPKKQTAKVTSAKLNHIALRKDKIVCNFGLSECNRVNFQTIEDSKN